MFPVTAAVKMEKMSTGEAMDFMASAYVKQFTARIEKMRKTGNDGIEGILEAFMDLRTWVEQVRKESNGRHKWISPRVFEQGILNGLKEKAGSSPLDDMTNLSLGLAHL